MLGCWDAGMENERWENLEVWKLADELALRVYLVTKGFPKDELYRITSQIQRAALSIPTNIVKGYSKKVDKELSHFLSISFASSSEVKYLIHFTRRLGYLSEEEAGHLESSCDKVRKRLCSFYSRIKHSS